MISIKISHGVTTALLMNISTAFNAYSSDRESMLSKITEDGYRIISSHADADRTGWINQISLFFYSPGKGEILCNQWKNPECFGEEMGEITHDPEDLDKTSNELIKSGYSLDHILVIPGSGQVTVYRYLSNNKKKFNIAICSKTKCFGYK